MKRITLCLTLLVLSLGVTRQVRADVITYGPTNFDIGSAQTSAALTFQQFDPTLGTLTGVSFAVSDANSAFIMSVLNNTQVQQNGTPSVTTTIGLTAPDLNSQHSLTLNGNPLSIAPGATGQFNVLSTSESGPFSPSSLTGYKGVGTFAFDVQRTITLAFAPGTGVLSAPNPETTGHVAVTYTYAPLAAPEPGSLLLFGTGVVGLAGYAWRRGRSALAVAA